MGELDYWIEMAGQDGFVNVSQDSSPYRFSGNESFCDIFGDLGSLPVRLDEPDQSNFQSNTIDEGDFYRATQKEISVPTTQPANPVPSEYIPGAPNARSDKTCEDEPTEQLASRLGRLRIAEDGHLRYYGATSNLHMIENGLVSCFQPTIRTVSTHGQEALKRAGLEWRGDEEYENHITKLFFAWHNTFQCLVHEPVYYDHRNRYKSDLRAAYYSPTLENAM